MVGKVMSPNFIEYSAITSITMELGNMGSNTEFSSQEWEKVARHLARVYTLKKATDLRIGQLIDSKETCNKQLIWPHQ